MNVQLLAHTKLSDSFYEMLPRDVKTMLKSRQITDGQAVSVSAIRCCYSANKPSEIIEKEGAKYFGNPASDGKGGTEADRLIRHIMSSKHLSTVEHLSFTFAIEGVSRALLAQLTRHRVGFSFSAQSQRYVRFGSDDKTGGFDYIVPPSVQEKCPKLFNEIMQRIQDDYDTLREIYGIPPEDARMVLPNAAATNLVMTANLRALLDFYSKRRKGRGAQAEIAELAEKLREAVIAVEPWTDAFFEQA